jgi:hypothetical protein
VHLGVIFLLADKDAALALERMFVYCIVNVHVLMIHFRLSSCN